MILPQGNATHPSASSLVSSAPQIPEGPETLRSLISFLASRSQDPGEFLNGVVGGMGIEKIKETFKLGKSPAKELGFGQAQAGATGSSDQAMMQALMNMRDQQLAGAIQGGGQGLPQGGPSPLGAAPGALASRMAGGMPTPRPPMPGANPSTAVSQLLTQHPAFLQSRGFAPMSR